MIEVGYLWVRRNIDTAIHAASATCNDRLNLQQACSLIVGLIRSLRLASKTNSAQPSIEGTLRLFYETETACPRTLDSLGNTNPPSRFSGKSFPSQPRTDCCTMFCRKGNTLM